MRLEKLKGVRVEGQRWGWAGGGRSLTTATRPGPVKFCRFSPDGRFFASTSYDCTIRLWDAAEAKCLQILKGEWAGWDCEPSSQAWVPFWTVLCPVPPCRSPAECGNSQLQSRLQAAGIGWLGQAGDALGGAGI